MACGAEKGLSRECEGLISAGEDGRPSGWPCLPIDACGDSNVDFGSHSEVGVQLESDFRFIEAMSVGTSVGVVLEGSF